MARKRRERGTHGREVERVADPEADPVGPRHDGGEQQLGDVQLEEEGEEGVGVDVERVGPVFGWRWRGWRAEVLVQYVQFSCADSILPRAQEKKGRDSVANLCMKRTAELERTTRLFDLSRGRASHVAGTGSTEPCKQVSSSIRFRQETDKRRREAEQNTHHKVVETSNPIPKKCTRTNEQTVARVRENP